MQQGRRGGRQDAGGSQHDQSAIEAQHEAVIPIRAFQKAVGDHLQQHQLKQVIRRDGNVRDLPGNGGSVADGDAHICRRQGRGSR